MGPNITAELLFLFTFRIALKHIIMHIILEIVTKCYLASLCHVKTLHVVGVTAPTAAHRFADSNRDNDEKL